MKIRLASLFLSALLLTVLGAALPAQAEAPATTPADASAPSAFWLEVGSGHIWTGEGTYGYQLDTAEWNLQLTAGWQTTEHFGLAAGVTRDTATVVEWMRDHYFTTQTTPEKYRYTALDLLATWRLNPGAKVDLVFSIGPTVYFEGGLEKVGATAGAAVEVALARRCYVSGSLKYRHVQGFLVPVANVAETGIHFGIRF